MQTTQRAGAWVAAATSLFILTSTLPSARGQSINIDIGGGSGTPPDTYAAAGLPGVWNNSDDSPESSLLVGLDGTPTGAAFHSDFWWGPADAWDVPDTCSDHQRLLDDGYGLGDVVESLGILGLEPGPYRVLTYAYNSGSGGTDIEMPGAEGSVGQWVSGTWSGVLQQGVTHADHTITLTGAGGSITIQVAGSLAGGGVISGIQIVSLDCNGNGSRDDEDIADSTSQDCNDNGYPDECEPSLDCNNNGTQDICDVADNTSTDCNENGIPDECEPPDDCNGNNTPDICDVGSCASDDCDYNGVPDECQADCNSNGVADTCDLSDGTSHDCTENEIPDECDIAAGTSVDVDENGVPDECQQILRVPAEYANIRSAFDAANIGATILLADGTYRGQSNRVDLEDKNVTVRSQNGPARCIIDCGGGTGWGTSAFRVNGGSPPGPFIEGLTITNCSRAAVDSWRGSPTIRDCIITGNETGVILAREGTPTIDNCVIMNNDTGISCSGNIWPRNHTTVRGSLIFNNRSERHGAGISLGDADLTISNSIIVGNATDDRGGAIYLAERSILVARNTTIANNTASEGGGIYASEDSSVSLSNSILWGNAPDQLTGAQVSVEFSDVQDSWPGTGNIDDDPLFVDSDHGNYHLPPDSPCVDTGDPGFEPDPDETDIDGHPRVSGGRMDMGADEYLPLDCNENGYPDDQDLAGGASPDCNYNNVPDECDIADGTSEDCNANGVPDLCDIAGGFSVDCNGNDIPDDCIDLEDDCNANGVPDSCDRADGTSADCNRNHELDECDIAEGTSQDCSGNGIPDECEPDCTRNGIADSCDLFTGTSDDCDGNEIPDECDTGWPEAAKLMASDAEEQDVFGYTVAFNGRCVVVGAPNEGNTGGGSSGWDGVGAVYVYEKDGIELSEQAKLTASDGEASDYFGCALAVGEDVIVVGSRGDSDWGDSSGAAYVFAWDGASWIEQAKLTASDANSGASFGDSVALDQDIIVIGAGSDRGAGYFAGACYVFERTGADWTEAAKLYASDPTLYSGFGRSVAIHDGTIVVGAYNANVGIHNSGAAYVFELVGADWIERAKLSPSDPDSAKDFGYAIALDDDTLVVGAQVYHSWLGSAYVIERDGSNWVEQAKLRPIDAGGNDYFGSAVALDGDTIVVGALGDSELGNRSGSAYVFTRTGGTWIEKAELTASDGSEDDLFGYSVAVNQGVIVVGARGDTDTEGKTGFVKVFAGYLSDCDDDGTPDACQVPPLGTNVSVRPRPHRRSIFAGTRIVRGYASAGT